MGNSNSCLPISLNTSHLLRRRSSKTKLKQDREQQQSIELINDNSNRININRASEDEFLLLPNITRQLAENIVQYRQINDGFKQLNDILNVNGINYDLFKHICFDISIDSLSNVRPHVTADHPESPTSVDNLSSTFNRNNNAVDSHSLASLLLETLPPELQTILLSSPPQRPSTIPETKQKSFRFASWNLQQLTNDKAQNPGVREVICRVILENSFSLIGIQEIGNKESLDYIIEELNHPTIPLIKDWPNQHHRKWKCTISDVSGRMFQGSEYLGFVYNESIGIELKKASLLPFKTYFTRSPYITIFCLYDQIEFVFVNIHLKARRLDENERTKDEALSLSVLAQAMKDTVEQKHIIIFGDFNLVPTASEFEALVKCNYSYVIERNTNISFKTPQGSTCMDNIWLSGEAKALSTEKSGVIRDNLTSMWIPAGWSWGGLVSDHCPIWIEFDLS